jgi:hypothetical protein
VAFHGKIEALTERFDWVSAVHHLVFANRSNEMAWTYQDGKLEVAQTVLRRPVYGRHQYQLARDHSASGREIPI